MNLPNVGDVRPPRVFISHAGRDGCAAARLAQDLEDRHIKTFVDIRDIGPGDNVVLAIDRALIESDYFLLLWSQRCADRENVEYEVAAALAREIHTRRAFIFIVRLDPSYPLGLLAPRRFLDAFDGWDEAVTQLADIWNRDREVGLPVLPAPDPVATNGTTPIVVYIRNRALSVAHVLAVPSGCDGQMFDKLVRTNLALPERATEFDGRTGVKFEYQLMFDGAALPTNGTLETVGIVDYSTIDLEVWVQPFGPDGAIGGGTVMRGPDDPLPLSGGGTATIAPSTVRSLVRGAFAHLTPGR